jgi:hypothetical protein
MMGNLKSPPAWIRSDSKIKFLEVSLCNADEVPVDYMCDLLLTFARSCVAHQTYLEDFKASILRSGLAFEMYCSLMLDLFEHWKMKVTWYSRALGTIYSQKMEQIRSLLSDFQEFRQFKRESFGASSFGTEDQKFLHLKF